MRETIFSPQAAAAAIIFTVIMFVNTFVKAQSNEYQVANPKVSQDTWHHEKPCPPCPTFPVTKQNSPKRLPGTNGAYIEFNPKIIVNPAQCTGNNNCGTQNQNAYVPLQNDGFRTWDMITCGLIFILFGFIIGLLYKTHNNHNHGHSHHHETNHNYLGDTMIDNTEKKGSH